MKHEPHDFEAPTRRAELKEWLATLRGPKKLSPETNAALDYILDKLSTMSSRGLITDDLGYRR